MNCLKKVLPEVEDERIIQDFAFHSAINVKHSTDNRDELN